MFNLLTLDDLHSLHLSLGASYHKIHARMMDGMTPLIPVLSDEWGILSAVCRDLAETADAVYAEILRREREQHADPAPGNPVLRRICDDA